MSPQNRAAFLVSAKVYPFSIQPSPLGTPGPTQILVENHAIAINPIDVKLQKEAFYPLTYPTVLGQDVAGEVIAIGDQVKRFKIGDRVIGCAAGFATKKDAEKAFQAYTVLEERLTASIGNEIAYHDAVVLPLAVATASAGLFNKEFLALDLPSDPKRPSNGKVVLIWGGASSVGSCAIQLARVAGYEVITTASSKNFEYVRKLGANEVFDYRSNSVVTNVVIAMKGRELAGIYDAIGGPEVWPACIRIAQQSHGKKFIATVIPGFAAPPEGVTIRQVQALTCKDNGIGEAVFGNFLTLALESGRFMPAPPPFIAGMGLEEVQRGMDVLAQGVSVRKVVIDLKGPSE